MKIEYGDARKIQFPNNYFDAIISCDVIKQIKERSLLLKNIYNSLVCKGILIIETDNKIRAKLGGLLRRILCILKLNNPIEWNYAWADIEGGHIALTTPFSLSVVAKKMDSSIAKSAFLWKGFHSLIIFFHQYLFLSRRNHERGLL